MLEQLEICRAVAKRISARTEHCKHSHFSKLILLFLTVSVGGVSRCDARTGQLSVSI